MKKQLKVGLAVGGGVPPGYCWNVAYLHEAREDAMSFLSEAQYAHIVDQFRSLAREEEPSRPVTVSVDAVEDFFELRDKGGILGKINVRIFFVVERETSTILVLAAIKKESQGQTPVWAKIRVRYRLRKYKGLTSK